LPFNPAAAAQIEDRRKLGSEYHIRVPAENHRLQPGFSLPNWNPWLMNDRGPIMKDLYFDELTAGAKFQSERFAVPAKEIIEFAEKFDPQKFHLNARSAERSIFKGLVASGWHTAAITMRLFVKTLNFAEGAIGLGVDELRWPNAVRPGDELSVETEILEARSSRSKPDHGVIRLRNTTKNQRGEIVQTMTANALVPRRKGDAAGDH
jgi:acyl dehydratase